MNSILSIYILAPGIAWLAAQVVKTAIAMGRHEHLTVYQEFMRSGSMPSSHTAITVALLVVVGARTGIDSALFGIAFVLTAIVIYDALNVRRAVGEQGVVLKKLASNTPFFTAAGHRPAEVVVGAIIGLAVALLMLQIL